MKTKLLLKSIAILVLVVLPFLSIAQHPIVDTKKGKIQGTTEKNIQIFKGIPFAAPPVGELRWKAPQPVAAWENVKNCTAFGPSPMQGKPAPFLFWSKEYLIPESPISEDCLYLNVWTKSTQNTAKMPVIVYIYGGGFRSGGSACPIYDGTATAQKDVVFVSINYRVGVFGFLAHPELSAEHTKNTSGNYALLDMIAALKWVQDNIASFGGDPNNVTIAGQSAGAFAVNYLTASPLSAGLFHKAIAESGGSFLTPPNMPDFDLKAAEQQGVEFAKNLGASSLSALRQIDADKILASQGGTSWPIIDGYVLPTAVYKTYKEGKQHDVPMLMGWNKDDLVFVGNKTAKEYKADVQKKYGAMADAFLREYPAHTDEEALASQKALARDDAFGSQVFTWAKMQTLTGTAPVYLYNFNRTTPYTNEDTNFGSFHSSEIVYAYNNLHTSDRPWEKIDYYLAELMSTYWTNFATHGNPNGKELPKWKAYNNTDYKTLIIDTTVSSKNLPDLSKMKVWEQYSQ